MVQLGNTERRPEKKLQKKPWKELAKNVKN